MLLLIVLVARNTDENEVLEIGEVVLAGPSPSGQVVGVVFDRNSIDLISLNLEECLMLLLLVI